MPATGMYRGVPAQARQAERRERLLDAALDLLGTEGSSATTVRAVCRRARLTPRFFYESFEDLDALLVAVLDRIVAQATARMLAALDAAPPDDHGARARAAIGSFVDALTDDPRLARVAFQEALGSERMMRRRFEVVRAMTALVVEHGTEAYDPPPEARQLVELTATMLVGGLAEVLLSWLDGGLSQDRDQLVEDFAAVFVAAGDAAADLARVRARARATRSR